MADPIAFDPLPSLPPQSLVTGCDARDCRYNQSSACAAGAITLAVVQGTVVCATYSPRTDNE